MASVIVFISYSRSDSAFANRLKADLRLAGATVWIDHESLPLGTSDWQVAIKRGIEAASAVIYIGSPEAAESVYIQGELAYAKHVFENAGNNSGMPRRQIYPVWAIGESWPQCAPISIIPAQYLDARGREYSNALDSLCKNLGLSRHKWPTIEIGSYVSSVRWSPNGSQIASGDDLVHLWDSNTGQLLATLSGHTGRIHAVTWSPDGSRLAAAGDDQIIRVWIANPPNPRPTATLTGHSASIESLAWAPDGSHLASASVDGTVRVWDPDAAPSLVATLRKPPSGLVAALPIPNDNPIKRGLKMVLDAVAAEQENHDALFDVAWASDSARIAIVGTGDLVWVWEPKSGTLLSSRNSSVPQLLSLASPQLEDLCCAVWSPDGSQLASAGTDRTIYVWDTVPGHSPVPLPSHRGRINSLAWQPRMGYLASASDDRTIRLWEPAFTRLVSILEGHTAAVQSVDWSRDGTKLVSGGADGTIRVWRISESPSAEAESAG